MIIRNTLTYSLILLGVMFSQCGSSFKPDREDEINGIKILFTVPMPIDSNHIQQVSDSIFVFFYKNYTAYKIPYMHTYNIIEVDKSGKMVGQRSTPEIRYKYFCYKDSNSFGMRYDSSSARTGTKISVDSFLATYGVGTFALPKNYQDMYLLTNSTINADRLVQKYIARNIVDPQSYDSIYLYFSDKFNKIPFSIAKGKDRFDQKKLTKIRYLFNSKYDIEHSIIMLKREIGLEMQKINIIENHNEINGIFRKLTDEMK